MKQNTPLFRLLTQIQDEVHRFAITFHRDKRSKRQIASALDEIKDVYKRQAGDVVGSIAHQSQHVDDLLGGLYAELRLYLFRAHNLESAGMLGAVHEDAV